GSRRRILQTSRPSISGSIKSRTIRSGRSARATASASSPSLAATGVKPAVRKLRLRTSSASGSSSTISTLGFMRLEAGVADVAKLVEVHDLLRNVGGVVGHAFESL